MARSTPALVLLALLLPLMAPFATAQGLPSIEISCNPSQVSFDVYPGATRVGTAYCELTNDSSVTETVEIDVAASGYTFAAPGSITVPAGDTISFEVAYRADDNSEPGETVSTIEAQVEQANGVDISLLGVSDEANVTLVIDSFSYPFIEMSRSYANLDAGQRYDGLAATVRNDGNADDECSVRILDENALSLQGVNFTISPDSASIQAGGVADFYFVVEASEDVADARVEVEVEARCPSFGIYTHKAVVNLNLTAASESLIPNFAAGEIPTWAYAGGGIIGVLILAAVGMVIFRRVRGVVQSASAYEDDDGDDWEDEYDDDDDLDEELEDLDDFDDLDDLDLDDL